ncbi:hypothetical protein SAMN06265338_12311 [Rhodoblastus acidophilus]|uniref:HTH luxR-type domain-containing protein n=1 Tax=Rhodoblastus acidophilus TaxID=1074 RepID=A0A212SBI2_RHOAC|nr:hypothetical protein [Rhodoblastus acidophilus]MCW2319102.1 hypothetical protein [Rhodoblastus acidophilus]SNB82890.1 hypothetical protein SAMN06265338_12311 [Rhodoblastus acidophilus]
MSVSQQFASLNAGEQAVFNLITSRATDQEICRMLKFEREDLVDAVAHINAVFGVADQTDLASKILPLLLQNPERSETGRR